MTKLGYFITENFQMDWWEFIIIIMQESYNYQGYLVIWLVVYKTNNKPVLPKETLNKCLLYQSLSLLAKKPVDATSDL